MLAAALTYLIIHQRDSVSLGHLRSGLAQRVAAQQPARPYPDDLAATGKPEPQDKTGIAPLLHDLAQQAHARAGWCFCISDCFDEVGSLLTGLQHLRFQGHEVTVFHILHPDEIGFPFEGMTKFDGMEESMQVLTRPQLIRPAYLRAVQSVLERTANRLSG